MEQNKKDLWKAIGISLVVAFVGAVLWGLLYNLGWFVSLISYVTAFVMLKMFNKYYKTEKNWKYFYVILTIVVFNIIASLVSEIRVLTRYGYTTSEAISAVFNAMGSFNLFTLDIILGIVWTIMGVCSTIRVEKKKAMQEAYYEKQQQNRDELEKEEMAQMRKMLEEQEAEEERKNAESAESEQKEPENELTKMFNKAKEDAENQENVEEVKSETEEVKTEEAHKHNFCTSCGAKLNEGDTKCSACGADVED